MSERDDGLAALGRGDNAEGIRLLEPLLNATPDYEVASRVGIAYSTLKKHGEAVAALTKAVQLEPGNSQARFNLGRAMERGGWTPQAIEAYKQALMLQPDYPQARAALAKLDPEGVAALPAAVQPNPVLSVASITTTAPVTAEAMRPAVGVVAPQPERESRPAQAGIDLGKACQEILEVLRGPRAFFAQQKGATGFQQCLSAIIIFAIVDAVVGDIAALIHGANMLMPWAVSAVFLVIGTVLLRLGGFLVHRLSTMFGGSGTEDECNRIVVFGYVALWIAGMLTTLTGAMGHPGTAAYSGILMLNALILVAAIVWSFVLGIAGLEELEGIQRGAALAVWLLTGFIFAAGFTIVAIIIMMVGGAALFGFFGRH